MNKNIFTQWRSFGLDPKAVILQKFPIGKEVKGFAGPAKIIGYDGAFTNSTGQIEIAYLNPKQAGRKADIITVSNLISLNP